MNLASWVIIGLAVISGILLSNSITGFIISESCCFPPGCPVENQCFAAQPESPSGEPLYLFIGGLVTIIVAIAYVILLTRLEKKLKR